MFIKQNVIRACLLAGILAASPTHGQPLEKINVALGADGVQVSALHIAIGAGFFKEEGLDATIVDVGSGPRQIAALIGGSALFAPTGLVQNIKINAQEPGMLAAAANLFGIIDPQMVISSAAIAKIGITRDMPVEERLKRLEGLKIGIGGSAGGSIDVSLRSLYKSRGMDPDKMLQILPMGSDGASMLVSMQQGLIDGFIMSAPFPKLAEQNGTGEIVINPFTDDLPERKNTTYNVMVINRATIEENADKLRRAVRALTKALNFAAENPDAAKEIVQKHFNNVDPALFDTIWADYSKGIPKTPVISKDVFDGTQKWLNTATDTKFSIKYSDAVVNQFAEGAEKDIIPSK